MWAWLIMDYVVKEVKNQYPNLFLISIYIQININIHNDSQIKSISKSNPDTPTFRFTRTDLVTGSAL